MKPEGQRIPVFELHIRPMFRLLDREHMLTHVEAGFDLWELERVWEMRNDILMRLRREGGRNMPGVAVGGPWPAEWIDLFERWMQNPNADDIGHHLVLGKPDGPYRIQPVSDDRRRLCATVTAPSGGCRTWFALDSVARGRREYTLYLEPALPAQPAAATPLEALEMSRRGRRRSSWSTTPQGCTSCPSRSGQSVQAHRRTSASGTTRSSGPPAMSMRPPP